MPMALPLFVQKYINVSLGYFVLKFNNKECRAGKAKHSLIYGNLLQHSLQFISISISHRNHPYFANISFRSSIVLISPAFLSFRQRRIRGKRRATPDL